MQNRYDIGDRPTLIATFRDADGALTDPTAILFQLKDPAGVIVDGDEADATNPSVGKWLWPIPLVLDQSGTWSMRAAATAGIQTAAEIQFTVRPSAFT